MNEPEEYNLTWRDDAELDAILLAGKIIGLADIERALGSGATESQDSHTPASRG